MINKQHLALDGLMEEIAKREREGDIVVKPRWACGCYSRRI